MSSTTATTPPPPPPETLTFPDAWATKLTPYLPPPTPSSTTRPFTTLTYAQSLDSRLSLGPGLRTAISGPATKAMTHFLRSRHAAILVGVGTALADDPALNCRLADARSPRPLVLDPSARWDVGEESRVVKLAREGRGRPPWILYAEGAVVGEGRRRVVEGVGGRYVAVPVAREEGGGAGGRLAWEAVLRVLWEEGVASVMVEGGAGVINGLLELVDRGVHVVDSVVVTVAPVWLGAGGVAVAPVRREGEGLRLGGVRWVPMEEDVVLCGRILR